MSSCMIPKLRMHALEQLHSDKVDAVYLDQETLKYARNEHQFLFVDFFACEEYAFLHLFV